MFTKPEQYQQHTGPVEASCSFCIMSNRESITKNSDRIYDLALAVSAMKAKFVIVGALGAVIGTIIGSLATHLLIGG